MQQLSSAHTGEFDNLAALKELYIYVNKYYSDIMATLDESPTARKLGLGHKLKSLAMSVYPQSSCWTLTMQTHLTLRKENHVFPEIWKNFNIYWASCWNALNKSPLGSSLVVHMGQYFSPHCLGFKATTSRMWFVLMKSILYLISNNAEPSIKGLRLQERKEKCKFWLVGI